MEIHSPMDAVELSRIRAIGEKVQQLQKEGRDIVRLQIGEPDFTTPGHIIAAAKAAMDHGQTHYAPNRGLASLREEISRKLLRDNGITADPATEILVTSGCAEGLVLNTPGNPTGAVYPREVLQQIAALAQEQDFLVLSDEVYEKLIYDGAQHVSIASLDGMKERTITINGFSKAFAMTGWRMGYLAADARLILPMLKVHQYAVASSNIIAQSAAITALQAGESCVEEMRREYARRRQFLLDAFAQIPEISCVAPAGTFYIYPNISGTGLSGTEFADKFLMEAGVATVPGTAFDSFCNSHIRLSYASSMESLQTAVSRLKGMLKK